MIRINLLPVKDEEIAAQARVQFLLFAGLLVIEMIVLFLIYASNTADLEERKAQVAQKQQTVNRIQKDVDDAEQLKAQTAVLEQQLSVLNQLKEQRSGPVRVLDELQEMMSPPRDEEARFAQLQKNWNVEWDTRRLWVEEFSEDKGSFKMGGAAANADDVAEFLQRLNTAEHFYNIELDIVQARELKSKDTRRSIRYVEFKIEGKLSYRGKSKEPPPEPEPAKGQKRKRK